LGPMEWQSMIKLTRKLNILVQRRASIGDVIMTTGVVRELKKRYGSNADIDVATDYAEVYRNNPHIRNVFPVDQIPPVNNRYDIYYNLDDAYEYNSYTSYLDSYYYHVFGAVQLDKSVELFDTAEDATAIDGDYFVVHLRNWHWQAKNIDLQVWFDVFAQVFEQRPDIKVVCVGGDTDHYIEHPNFIDARNRTSQQIKALCDHAQCFVGIDSGPFWCAAASRTHIIGVLTHLLPERIMPERRRDYMYNATAIQTLEDCAGCNDRQARPIRQIVCEKTNFPCTKNFDASAIASAILKTL
jgi:ADP-heptose:LPS heptosyltransferase